jgi:GntR family transcriptional regulator
MTSAAAATSYHQVADAIRRQIAGGELAPGTVLPSESELGRQHGVSRATARLALIQLVNEGLVTGGQGRKRTVRDRAPLMVYASRSESVERRTAAGVDAWVTDVGEQGHEPSQAITIEVVQANADIARWLEINEGDLVAVRRRPRFVDGQPANMSDSYYPMDLAQEIPELMNPADVPQGVIALMRERGHAQVRYIDELRWRPPTPDESARLDLAAGVAVLIQARTGHTANRPVRCTVTVWPGDSHVMIYELPA